MAKKKKNSDKIGKIETIILFIISGIFTLLIVFLNIIPSKYLYIIIGVIVLIFLIFLVSLKKKKNKKAKVFAFLYILILLFSSYYLFSTVDLLSYFKGKSYKEERYIIYVLKSSNFNSINDLNNKTIGYVNDSKKALDSLVKSINIEKKSYSDISLLANDLLKENIFSILLKDAEYDLICEMIPEFSSLTKAISEKTIKEEIKIDTNKKDITKEAFNVYLSGIDTYGSVNKSSRSDVNIIATINPKTHKILLTSIPRDYYVKLNGDSTKMDKLTHAGIYGVTSSMKTIESLLNTEINYYVKVNFSSVIKIVDTLNGIDVNSNYSFTSMDNYTYKKGINHLDGKKTLSFVRERHAFDSLGGDRVRGENQQIVLKALLNKATSPEILPKYTSLLKNIKNSFTTNLTDDDITSFIKMQLDTNPKWEVLTYNLNGSNYYAKTYSYSLHKLYVMLPDEKTVKEAEDKIKLLLTN